MKIAIVHMSIDDSSSPDNQDVMAQVQAVNQALVRLGHETLRLPCTLDLADLQQRLQVAAPEMVFNLVESLAGTDRLMPLVPMLLSSMGVAYTGTEPTGLVLSGDKIAAKQQLRAAGLPTPDWWSAENTDAQYDSPPLAPELTTKAIVKPVFEHASFGMDDACVLEVSSIDELRQAIDSRQQATGRAWFAERFIDGRELNLSVLEQDDAQPQVLPPAEIDFSGLPADKPRIVGYLAKWDEASVEYQQTPRTFQFPAADQRLLQRLSELTRDCWRLFRLRGYARVDFRIGEDAQPTILEVNANPCLSPDAGFAAALAEAQIDFDLAIFRILTSAGRISQGAYTCS